MPPPVVATRALPAANPNGSAMPRRAPLRIPSPRRSLPRPGHAPLASSRRTRRTRRAPGVVIASLVSLAVALVGATPALAAPRVGADAQREVTAVAAAVLDRLEVADDVAASKRLSGRPVTDPVREQAVVDATVRAARADGVDPVAAERIIRAQIAASTQVQHALLARWRAHPEEAPATAPDLATVVRPRIDAIDARLIPAIGDAADALDDPACRHLVTEARGALGGGLDDVHRKALRTALAAVCPPRA
ncbi:gamma subclass chorismate mutase AroQ [Clavibacter sp. MX14-G9D]|uniref:gamma subclass chorismate mutase AroQ n=1 Tax=Clavibacter sp. MX14-G9D TaxID=3064656 RepID=UPI00293E2CB2|nr:gamma subclass chorismate mutase AroQ [Clavibacter sp. MX14-G9D]